MDRDSFFDNLQGNSGERDEALRAQRQLAYEERIIKRVFTECGIKVGGWGRYANQCREATGHNNLNFAWFNTEFRRFPFWLAAKRVPRMYELTLPDLFKPVANNRLVKTVIKTVQRHPDFDGVTASKFALVFPVVRTSFVAYDAEVSAEEPSKDIGRIIWSVNAERPLFIEPSKTFFQAIGNSWFLD